VKYNRDMSAQAKACRSRATHAGPGQDHAIIMNTKLDKKLEPTAADPVRRRAAIAVLTRQRAMIFCSALVVTACALLMHFSHAQNPKSPMLIGLGAVLMWLVVFRIDFQRRALLLPDRGDPAKDEKPKV